MTLPKTKEPLESFAPELMEILLRAAKGEKITLTFPTAKMAHTFRRRLYTLRRRLRDSRPEDYKVVCRAEVGAVTQTGAAVGHQLAEATVTLRLKDSEFQDIIASATVEGAPVKIEIPKLEHDPLDEFEATDES